MALFRKECKTIGKSLTFWLFIAVTALFLYSQMPDIMWEKQEKPQPGQASYEKSKFVENPDVLMPAAGQALLDGFIQNEFTTYPNGFYKVVKLSETKRQKLAELLTKLTGYSKAELLNMSDTGGMQISPDQVNPDGSVTIDGNAPVKSGGEKYQSAPGLSYERFKEFMVDADTLLGGGSAFHPQGVEYQRFSQVPFTYEEALESYQLLVGKDGVTGAYARLFCDYAGCMLAVLPVFLAVAMGMRDGRAHRKELIYTRGISSARLVLTRYGALLTMLFLPVLIMAVGASIPVFLTYKGSGLALDSFAFVKYACGWLLPTVMATSAVGFFLTELTGTPIAVLVQGIWWFVDFFSRESGINGGAYGWALSPRHNELGNTQAFLDGFPELLRNRLAYAALAVVLVIVSIWIYDLKRKGRLDVSGKLRAMFHHREIKSKA